MDLSNQERKRGLKLALDLKVYVSCKFTPLLFQSYFKRNLSKGLLVRDSHALRRIHYTASDQPNPYPIANYEILQRNIFANLVFLRRIHYTASDHPNPYPITNYEILQRNIFANLVFEMRYIESRANIY